ncbi:MAG: hypothetical protein N2201_07365 [candidate division WOR-3 bacterium]|nr:hypothetical protein [candidate division WOR-3 bacterium]
MIILISAVIFNYGNINFEKDNQYGFLLNSSIEVLKFTPRWTIEPFPGRQIFQKSGIVFFCQICPVKKIAIAVQSGFGTYLHYSPFYSYFNYGMLDLDIKTSINFTEYIAGFLTARIPTGNYSKFLGEGTYAIKVGIQKRNCYKNIDLSFGGIWQGENPDKVDCGDKLFCQLKTKNNVLSLNYNFPDKGGLFDLYDSPSFSLDISVDVKSFKPWHGYKPKLILNQTILGRDTAMITRLSLLFIRIKQ